MIHEATFSVTFGDCDPAGIVFYPNMFRWMDATFHARLRPFGGHASLCERLDIKGVGLARSEARFRSAVTDGDVLSVGIASETWSDRRFTLRYEGRVGDRLAFEGHEERCLFKIGAAGMFAGSTKDLQDILEDSRDG